MPDAACQPPREYRVYACGKALTLNRSRNAGGGWMKYVVRAHTPAEAYALVLQRRAALDATEVGIVSVDCQLGIPGRNALLLSELQDKERRRREEVS